MKTPKILHCHDCRKSLTEFEESKWNRLLDFWGGNRRGNYPRCASCYYKNIERAAATRSKQTGVTHVAA